MISVLRFMVHAACFMMHTKVCKAQQAGFAYCLAEEVSVARLKVVLVLTMAVTVGFM